MYRKPRAWLPRAAISTVASATLLASTMPAYAGACGSAADKMRAQGRVTGGEAPGVQTLNLLDTKAHPLALCNDGTPGAYWFRPGSGEGATRWIISLEEGRKCTDDASCQTRAAHYPRLVSSNNIGNKPQQGILSPDPAVSPDFYDANMVQIHYCSSDYWSGGFSSGVAFNPADAQNTWNFQGRAIAEAVVADLQSQGLSAATDVLFSGSAAGGLGMTLIANDLIPEAPAGARVLVLDDAGYAIDVLGYDANGQAPNYTSPVMPTPSEVIVMQGMTLWRGRGDLPCTLAAGRNAKKAGLCIYSSYVVSNGWLPVPVLDLESQIDSAQMEDNNWKGPDKAGTPANGYATYFGAQMLPSLLGSGSADSVFAPYKLIHEMTDKDSKFTTPLTFPSGQITPQQAVSAWYAAPCTREVLTASPP